MKKLLIVAHPSYEHSHNIKELVEYIKHHAKNTDIHFLDPKGNFNIQKEQELITKYGTITFAFPMWWYSYPWTLTKWFDEVITPEFAYSFKGNLDGYKLRHKKFSYIVSAGSPSVVYAGHDSGNKHRVEEYFNGLDSLANLVSTAWNVTNHTESLDKYFIKPIVMHGASVGEAKPTEAAIEYINRIDSK